jgi:hypothetical protein
VTEESRNQLVAEFLEAKGYIESQLRKVTNQQDVGPVFGPLNRVDGTDVSDSDRKATRPAVEKARKWSGVVQHLAKGCYLS